MLTMTALHLMRERLEARPQFSGVWSSGPRIVATDTVGHSTTVAAAVNYRARPSKELAELKKK